MERQIINESEKDPHGRILKAEIIIPTLNEERTIRRMIHDIRNYGSSISVSITVVDGGSNDGTLEICKEENVRFIIQKRKGKGNAMREAVESSEAEIVVFIDADGTYSPSELGSLLKPLINKRADMVVGSRLLGKRGKGSISNLNMIGNRIFNGMINFAMGSEVTDSLSGYRAMFSQVFKDLILFSDRFDIEVEMTVEALARNYRIEEVPISYRAREGSRSKLSPLNDGSRIAHTLLFILMNVNPLRFFVLISAAFIIAGFYPAYFVLSEKIITGDITSVPAAIFSSLLFVTGTISLVVGLLSELVVRSRRRIEYMISKIR
jgi:dolichol-phosphate hexosyltransferase